MKIYFHKKCGVFSVCKKVTDFFDTLKKVPSVGDFLLHAASFDEYLRKALSELAEL